MSSVDNRIVKMGFENSQFENGAKTTMNTLERLKSSLNFDKAASAFSSIAEGAKHVNLEPIAESIENVSQKFSFMDVMGVTAMAKISNAAIDTGVKMAKALTIDPITAGFSEYETKMGAITTIMTNTKKHGTTLEDVGVALDELNEYADQTIYNFAHMTQNAGMFTAAGVKIEDATKAIKGMSNLAAGFGVNATDASRGMYQISQALASGKVELRDWMSVENANMGGTIFQDALRDKAEAMGIFVNRTKPFRETLKAGWLTNDVLIATLQDFAENEDFMKAASDVKTWTQLQSVMAESVQSSWTETWEFILGNKDEATQLFTAMNNGFSAVVGPLNEARNAAMKFWKENGGRENILKGLAAPMQAIGKILWALSEGFKAAFPQHAGEQLVKFSEAFRKFFELLVPGEALVKAMKEVFQAIFNILKPFIVILGLFWKLVGAAILLVSRLLAPIIKLLGVVALFVNKFGDIFHLVNTYASRAPKLNFFERFIKVIDWITEMTDKLMVKIYDLDFKPIYNFIDKFVSKLFAWWGDVATMLNAVMDDIGKAANDTIEWFKGIDWEPMLAWMEEMHVWVMETWDKIDFSKMRKFVLDWYENTRPIENSAKFIRNAFVVVKDAILAAWDFILLVGRKIGDVTRKVYGAIKNFLSGIAVADVLNGGMLATIIIGITQVKKIFDKLKEVTGGGKLRDSIVDLLGGVKDSLESYQKDVKANIIKKIAIAILILAGALWILSKIDPERLRGSLGSMLLIFTQLVLALIILGKTLKETQAASLGKLTGVMIGIGIGMFFLAMALESISQLGWKQLAKGLIAMAALFTMLIITLYALEMVDSKEIAKVSLALMLFAIAINMMGIAVRILATMKWNQLARGMTALGGILLAIGLFMKFGMGSGKQAIANAAGMILLGQSLFLIATAIALFGLMPYKMIFKGLGVMAGALAIISLTFMAIPKTALAAGGGVFILVHSLLMLAAAISVYSLIPWKMFLNGIAKVGLAVAILGLSMNLIAQPKTLMGVAALHLVAMALVPLAAGLMAIGSIDTKILFISIGALALLFTVITVSAVVLQNFTKGMFTLAGGIALIGLGVMLLGGGVLLLSMGLASLALSGVAAGIALLAFAGSVAAAGVVMAGGLVASITVFISGLLAATPLFVRAGVQILLAILSGFMGLIPVFVRALVLLGKELLKGLGLLIAPLGEFILKLVTEVVRIIKIGIPIIVEALAIMAIAVLRIIAATLPELLDLLFSIVKTLLTNLKRVLPEVIVVVGDFLLELLKYLAERVPQIVESGFELIFGFLLGVIDGVTKNMPKLIDNVTRMIVAFLDSVSDNLPRVMDSAANLIISFINGLGDTIRNNHAKVRSAIWNLITAIVDAIKGFWGDMVDAGRNIVEGLVSGIKNNISKVYNAIKDGVSKGIDKLLKFLGIFSPSRLFKGIGKNTILGMAVGISKNAYTVEDEILYVGDKTVEAMTDAMTRLQDVVDADMNLNPVVTPVLDLTELQNEGRDIAGMFGSSSYGLASRALGGARMNTIMNNEASGATVAAGGQTINNTFNISGTNARDIANEVSEIITRQIERRGVAWA